MHVDYPQQTRGRGTKEVDTGKPFIPIRLLMPHKTCGAIIGQKSETLINTRVNCAARRVYVYRERISESRERVVEVVGTPGSIARVMEVLGGQVSRTLNGDQQESELYTPERDGLRKFLSKQGVPRSRVSLEPIKGGEKNGSAGGSRKGASRKRSRSRSVSSSDESDASGRSQSRGRGRHARSSRRSRRSRSRSYSRSRSRSPGAKSHRSSRRSRRSRHRGHEKKSSRGHRNRSRSRSSGRSSASDSRSRSRSRSSSYSRSRSHSRSRSRSRSKSRRKTGSGNRRAADSHRRRRSSRAKDRRQSTGDKDDLVHEASDAEMYDANVGDQGADSGGERAMRTSGWENGDLSVDAWAVTNDEASDKMSGGALKDGGSW
ncbi:hypothetical protein FB639_000747 [Coemansia asiatica]|nr:hypothetical protein FB639_000747 [Coemansia asiatica]